MRPLTKEEIRASAFELTLEERGELVDDLIVNMAQERLPAWQREVLRERIAEDDASQEPGIPWVEVKRQILEG
jgi:Putative addiction module component